MTTIVAGVGASPTFGAVSGMRIYAFNNIGATPVQIVGESPGRQRMVVHNPGSVDVFVAPMFVQNGGTDTALSPSAAALGGCFQIYANGGTLEFMGEIQKAWQAFTASGSGYPLTVMDSAI